MNAFLEQFSLNIQEIDWRSMMDAVNLSYLSTFSWRDLIDVLVVAGILYRIIKLLKDTSAERLIKGVLVLVGAMLAATALQLITISYILRNVTGLGVFMLVVLFQPELRRMLEQLGKGSFGRWFTPADDPDAIEQSIEATVQACTIMSAERTGALIVFERFSRLGEIAATGTRVDAQPSPELIRNLFFHNSPLHDGAMLMREGRIYAAGCVLPLSGSKNLSRELGTRHRAAVGMSETADSVLVVVSEETGAISVAIGGMLKRNLSPAVLRRVLENELVVRTKEEKNRGMAALRNFWKGAGEK